MGEKIIEVSFQCSSNIALVKYWGKKPHGVQLPANPSISWNLGDLYATTTLKVFQRDTSDTPFVFTLSGKSKPSFEPKIEQFLLKIAVDCPWLKNYILHIDSENNFPHGTGIASSAAGFGALGLCIAKVEEDLGLLQNSTMDFWQRSSYLSRIGSGSACRSMYAAPAVWGETLAVEGSSDLYAVELGGEIHPLLTHWRDVVLIVDDGEKAVSSTAGHALLKDHPYAEARFAKAQLNLIDIVRAIRTGDVNRFIEIVESEALQLHAMMMTSVPYYLLICPNTLAIIEKIWQYRAETGMRLCFTLDAGANVHLLYDKKDETDTMNFVRKVLLPYCKNEQYLCSVIGLKPKQLR